MKKIILPIVLLFLLAAYSCKKTGEATEQKKLNQIALFDDDEDARVAFNMLTPEQKYSYAWTKLENAKSFYSLTSTQCALIDTVKSKMTVELYDPQNDQGRDIFTATQLPALMDLLHREFSDELLDNIFLNIINQTSDERYIIQENNSFYPSCKCKMGSSYTCPKFTLNISLSPSVGITYHGCPYGGCEYGGGCGFLWWSTCNGKCN